MRSSLLPHLVLVVATVSVSASPLVPPLPQLAARQIIETNLTAVDDTSFVNATGRLQRNCAYWAWYPDDGLVQFGSQGTMQTLQELNAATVLPAVAVGAYANIEARTYVPGDITTHFNGSEFLPYLQQAIEGEAIFVASVLPVHGYNGFMRNDTAQLEATINVLRTFVDAGVDVWLRFAHEFNWYTRRGSDDLDPTGRGKYYAGGAPDFVEAYQTTVDLVRAALPTIKHMWCPNVGGMDEIAPYWPGPEYVDIVGLDYYVESTAPHWRYDTLEPLVRQTHDEFALPYGKPFWLGETGTRTNSTVDNLRFVASITSAETCASMPNYQGAFWFNYVKGNIDHNVAVPGGSDITTRFVELMSDSEAI